MVFEGPGLPARVLAGLADRMQREGVGSISDIVGTETDAWRAKVAFDPPATSG